MTNDQVYYKLYESRNLRALMCEGTVYIRAEHCPDTLSINHAEAHTASDAPLAPVLDFSDTLGPENKFLSALGEAKRRRIRPAAMIAAPMPSASHTSMPSFLLPLSGGEYHQIWSSDIHPMPV